VSSTAKRHKMVCMDGETDDGEGKWSDSEAYHVSMDAGPCVNTFRSNLIGYTYFVPWGIYLYHINHAPVCDAKEDRFKCLKRDFTSHFHI
jgi:hypothetical protein